MITIILPVYNSIKYIKECLDSISKQTFTDWRLLIFDDGSTDGTLECLEEYVKNENRAILYKRSQSYISNLNEGIDLSDTKYIARMDADDIMYPERLQTQFEFMEAHTDIDLVCSSVECIKEDGSSNGYFGAFFPEQIMDASDLMFMNQIVHPSVLMRTESIKKNHIRYNEEFKYAEDWEMWTQMLEKRMKLYSLKTTLLKYRIVEKSMSRTHQEEIRKLRGEILTRLNKLR